ncbi:hypothetical protein ZWY2020_012294 [Hordeum vulgare]|nr:hypothetical protein ZWY2020_012294 [Hordeum vulgare]
MHDFIAWSPAKNGVFSVRSAYQTEWNSRFGNLIQVSTGSSSPSEKWELVWSLECPAKIRIFIWRLLQSAIPCRSVLASKHMKVKTQCPECKKGPDSIRHFLFECSRSSAVWKQLGMFDIVKRVCTKYKSGEEAIYELLHMETSGIILLGCPKLREVVATAAWYLWFEHRKVYHGDDIQTAPQIALAIRGLSANFSIACAKTAKGRTGGWSKPPHGYVKLNVDAGFDHDLLRGSIGAIIRDQNVQFLAAANDKIDICYDSNTAEALGVRFGLNLARTIGCSKIVVNSDNLEIVEDLKKGYSSSAASAIIDDCFFLGSEFKHVLYDHCGRDSNQVAHELAKLAKSSPPSCWMDSAPPKIIRAIVNDMITLIAE